MLLFTAMDMNSSISLLLITGNLDSSGHLFHYLNCQGERFQLFMNVETAIVYIDSKAQRQSPDCETRKVIIKTV